MSSQQITPDVIRWIATQARAGHEPDAVLSALRICGWSDEAARSAIEETKHFLHNQRPKPPAPSAPGLATLQPPKPAAVVEPDISSSQRLAPVPVPGPDLSSLPWTVQTSDREVQVLATMQLPRVIIFGGVLSHEECDGLIEHARKRLRRSNTLDNKTGGEELNEARTSDGMFFARGESELVQRIEKRIAELLAWPVDHGEGLQILRYGVGAEYRPHYDYFDPAMPSTASILKRGGQRVASLVIYLQTSAKGGSTVFPDVGFHVAPIKGNAVFFSYDAPHPTTHTLHGGAPVVEGEKWIATKWLREGVFV